MANVFYRNFHLEYPTAVKGSGCWLEDKMGRRYLDGSGGAAVSAIGHGNKRVISAVQKQVAAHAYSHSAFFSHEPQEQLAARLAARFHGDGARVYFTSGGSEAVETALKLARQYHIARGDSQRHIVVGRKGSYHGATLGALSASGTRRRSAFDPMLNKWPLCAPCYAYRHQKDNETPEAYAERAASSLRSVLEREGPENIAAFIAEPVVGSTLGAVPAVPNYFTRIRQICDEYGVLLICDEVMCGAGRTGHYLASDAFLAKPDIVVLAKGLAAGYQPLGAVLSSSHIHQALAEDCKSFEHGFTYGGHPVACAAGNAVLDELETENLLARVTDRGDYLKNALTNRLGGHPNVGDIRGSGLLLAVEFVEDKESAAPVSSERHLPALLRQAGMRNGLVCYPDGGNVDGDGAHVLLAPPYIITKDEIDQLVERLKLSIEQVLPNYD